MRITAVNKNVIRRLKRKSLILSQVALLIILFFPKISNAQPGAYGGFLNFKLYKNGELVNLSDKEWRVIPANITLADSTNTESYLLPDKKNDFFYIVPLPTPAGGIVSDDFFIDIIHQQDTMRIYPPNIQIQEIELDSIPFKKGIYKIPQTVYDFKEFSKKKDGYYEKVPLPNIYGNWDLFTKETYKCYIEKTEDIEWTSSYGRNENKEIFDWRNWQYLYIHEIGTNYYFFDNVIVKYKYDSREVTIYEVKDYSDSHYWSSGTPRVSNLFYKDDTIFAIINKGNNIKGVYKLHFVDEKMTKDLSYLERKQVIEEYEAYIKRLQKYNIDFRERETSQATERFNEIMKSFE